jgi:hypothetical protein
MSSASIAPPPVGPSPGTRPGVTRTDLVPPGPAVSAPPGARVPTMAEVAALHERIANLEALVRRDEDVLKKLMALLIEKGVATRDEILAKLR